MLHGSQHSGANILLHGFRKKKVEDTDETKNPKKNQTVVVCPLAFNIAVIPSPLRTLSLLPKAN